MNIDKYLLYDVYHVTKNLEIIHGTANKEDIIKYVAQTGKRNNREYKGEAIKKCITHLETIRTLKQCKKK